jgi:hypothetical protein
MQPSSSSETLVTIYQITTVRTSYIAFIFLFKGGASTSKAVRKKYNFCLRGRSVLFELFRSGKLRSVGLAGTRGALMCTGEHLGKIPLVKNNMKIARITLRVKFTVLEQDGIVEYCNGGVEPLGTVFVSMSRMSIDSYNGDLFHLM